MHEEIVGIIREVCGKDIDEDMSLFGDLQMDSVEMIELALKKSICLILKVMMN